MCSRLAQSSLGFPASRFSLQYQQSSLSPGCLQAGGRCVGLSPVSPVPRTHLTTQCAQGLPMARSRKSATATPLPTARCLGIEASVLRRWVSQACEDILNLRNLCLTHSFGPLMPVSRQTKTAGSRGPVPQSPGTLLLEKLTIEQKRIGQMRHGPPTSIRWRSTLTATGCAASTAFF